MSAAPAGAAEPTLCIENLRIRYATADGEVRVVRGVSLAVQAGECLGIVGESGSGKTQLFMAVMGLLGKSAQVEGRVRFEGEEILGIAPRALNRIRGARMSMIFQDPMTSLAPHLRIGIQLAEVLVQHRGISWREAGRAASRMLERVGIPDPGRRMRQYPHELSGGMRQRVMIGMGLMCEPTLIIADEPTSALDVTVQAQIIELLKDLRRGSAMAVALISHDLGVVAELAGRIVVMYAGRIVECASVRDLVHHARHPYTALLMQCVPTLREGRRERMATLAGTAPSAAIAARGCDFAPRCPRSSELCTAERPPLREAAAGRQVACHHPLP